MTTLGEIVRRYGAQYRAHYGDQLLPSQQAARDRCRASGGVYFVGSDACMLGSGGP